MNKNVLKPIPLFTSADMSGNLTSGAVNIQFLDNVSMQLVFTGVPVGTFSVEGSLDYEANPMAPDVVLNAGNWTAITLTPPPTASGGSDSILLDLYGLSFPYLRLVYTATSGSGFLTALASCKSI